MIKLKGDEREDLKVLATGVAAALIARKVSYCLELTFPLPYKLYKCNALCNAEFLAI